MAGDGSVPLKPERLVDAMSEAGMLPADMLAVFVGGSMARGWNNAWSDIDAYVVSATPWSSPSALMVEVPLDPPHIPMELLDLDGVLVDVEYWTPGQYEMVLARVDAWREGEPAALPKMAKEEYLLLERVGHPLVCAGQEWVARAQAGLAASTYRRQSVNLFFDYVDQRVEDALGQLAAGDVHSAVLSTQLAYGFAVDGTLAAHGEVGFNPKWRARRMAEVDPPELPFDAFWRVQVMADYDSADPAAWILATCRQCRRITTDVDAG